MTATLVSNLIASIVVVTVLAGVCRLAFLVAGGLLDGQAGSPEQSAAREREQLAA